MTLGQCNNVWKTGKKKCQRGWKTFELSLPLLVLYINMLPCCISGSRQLMVLICWHQCLCKALSQKGQLGGKYSLHLLFWLKPAVLSDNISWSFLLNTPLKWNRYLYHVKTDRTPYLSQ